MDTSKSVPLRAHNQVKLMLLNSLRKKIIFVQTKLNYFTVAKSKKKMEVKEKKGHR